MSFIDDLKAKAAANKAADAKKPIEVFTPKGRGKKVAINLLVTLLFGLVYFYIELPPVNLQAREFYFFFFMLSAVYCASAIVTSGIWKLRGDDKFLVSVKDNCKAPLIVCAAFLVIILVGSAISGQIIRSRAYRDLLEVTDGDFKTDVEEITFSQIPMLDRDSAERLGDRVLGELSDMVSQFEVSNDYSQINYNGRPVRVTPLEYGDWIKWFNNRTKGLPAYILVDMVTQEAEVVRLEEGMKYTETELFSRNLYRHIRFQYPTYMFAGATFEIDETGTPYWVCPRVVKRIGLFGGEDIRGAVLVNAVTGESEYFPNVPEWVDRVYSAELIMAQYDYHGLYVHGWLNSVLGQKDVTITTSGYNYIAMNDDVYMYTGITSVGNDQSNIGFILSNQRTKETEFFNVSGATEYSAEDSAEGVVQHLGYNSTFPLLLNIGGEPTYFMSLKDNAGLVKMYAMVNVSQYQIVATGASVAECEQNYIKLLKQNGVNTSPSAGTEVEDELIGVVEDIRSSVVEGNTIYYFKLEGNESYYSVYASASPEAALLNVGDTIKVEPVYGSEGAIIEAEKIEIVSQNAEVPEGGEEAAQPPTAEGAESAASGETVPETEETEQPTTPEVA